MGKMRTTILLADGAPPTHEVPLRLLREAGRLIACDGAWRMALSLGRTPDAVVGDGDSLGVEGRDELMRHGIPLVTEEEQGTNDLCKAFRYAMRTDENMGMIVILDATGKREDHSIGNIFHLIDFAQDKSEGEVMMVTDAGVFEPILPPGRSWTAMCRAGSSVSVFAPFSGTKMSSEGLVWPLKGVEFDSLWRGTLNQTIAGTFSIQTNRPALIFRPHDATVR